MVYSPQINVRGVFEDETPHVFLVDEIDIAVLLFSSRGAAQFGFQMAAFDPPRHCVGINSQSLCETISRWKENARRLIAMRRVLRYIFQSLIGVVAFTNPS